MQERQLISGCRDDSTGYNTQLLYFTCSSLSTDDQRIYLISDKDGHPNVYVKDLNSGVEQRLTDNRHGILKSYVYFDGNPGRGLGKASVCLDCKRDVVFFIQDNLICKVAADGKVHILNLEYVFDNICDILKYYNVTEEFQCVYDEEYGEIANGIDKATFSIDNNQDIELTFENLIDGFELGLGSIDEIGKFLLQHKSLKIADCITNGTI